MKPLTGMRVVSIAYNLPGPAAVAQLDRWGASVLKVEPPGGDPAQSACPELYAHLLGGQQAVRLDLKQPGDRQLLEKELASADLLVTSHLAESLARLELDWPRLHARHPRLCHVAIVGYPPPDDGLTGHDLNYQAAAGLVSPPHMPRTLLADLAGAQLAVSHALAVLAERQRTGEGLFSLVPIAEAVATMCLPLEFGLTVPGGRLAGALPYYNLYETRAGWLAVGALEPQFQQKLQSLLKLEALDHASLQRAFRTRSAPEWEAWGAEHRLPLNAVQVPDSRL